MHFKCFKKFLFLPKLYRLVPLFLWQNKSAETKGGIMTRKKSSSKFELDDLLCENDEENSLYDTKSENTLVLKKVKRKKREPFKKTLEKILSMRADENTVSKAVFLSSLGKNLSYQEAILLALVIKAANGDIQAATFIRDTSGNKQNNEDENERSLKFEDL